MESPEKTVHSERPERAMVIVAHPDDADFGPAGTIARWVDAGTIAHLVCCTSGEQGGEDPNLDPLELAARREKEQRDAARIVGYEDVTFLHQPDGALANDLNVREQLVRVLRRFRPDAVLTIDPRVLVSRWGHVQHTDHRAAGIAALDAIYPASQNPMAFPHLMLEEGLEPHAIPSVYLFWSEQPNAWVDTSDTVERKIAALQAHVSQISKPDELAKEIREWATEQGKAIGTAAAEAFWYSKADS
jgi:LmbE family N-acetylglucosaminyl deacetylase